MALNDQAISDTFDRVVSLALASGRFEAVNQHEPKNSPGNGVTCAVWMQRIRPIRSSGLNATSGLFLLEARVYTNFKSIPFDAIDPNVTSAVTELMTELSGDFEFGGVADARAIDLLGSQGTPLGAQAGYVEIDKVVHRVMTVDIPIIMNDMFLQEP